MKASVWTTMVPLFVVLALVISGCGGSAAPPEEPVAPAPDTGEPVVLRVGLPGFPDAQNPGNAWLTEATDLFELVYSSLVKMDFSGAYYPDLAKSWSVSEDGLTWTFNLEPEAVWSDGTPVTAEDVAFTLLAYRDWGDFGYMSGYTYYITDVQAPDDHTAVILLEVTGRQLREPGDLHLHLAEAHLGCVRRRYRCRPGVRER